MSDRYTKVLLTIITIAVVIMAGQGIIEHIQADRAGEAIGALNAAPR